MAKVLLVHPDLSRLGGIENYYLKIKPHFKIAHQSCGNSRRPGETGVLSRIRRIFGDYMSFWRYVAHDEITVVHLNPSLQAKMFYRDFVYLWIAKLHGKKVVVFFRGWDNQFQQRLQRGSGRMMRLLYGRADAFIVLAAAFDDTLRSWGIQKPIYREVVVIEDEVFNRIQLDRLLQQRDQAKIKQLLFPARIIHSKGIVTTIDALATVQALRPDTGLIVAGDGDDLQDARQQVEVLNLAHVRFTGTVSGETKYDLFGEAHLLCFPTEHSEGFPNTIVEAMAFGLPVITRPVGAVRDFFIDGEHGYVTESTQPEDFARYIERLLEDPALYEKMARANHRYAQEHFLASQAARRLEQIYQQVQEP